MNGGNLQRRAEAEMWRCALIKRGNPSWTLLAVIFVFNCTLVIAVGDCFFVRMSGMCRGVAFCGEMSVCALGVGKSWRWSSESSVSQDMMSKAK